MSLTRVASSNLTAQLNVDNMRLQSRMSEVQTQLSTGLKSMDYKDISRDAQRLLALEATSSQLKGYSDNGKLVLNQVNIAYDTFGRMDELGNKMITALTAALGGNQVDPTVTTAQSKIALDEFAALLNTTVAGRHLFGGNDIDTKPVDITDPGWPAQTTPSTPNSNYYQGDTAKLKVQLSETLTVSYGVLASDPAFEQMMRGLNLAVNNSGDAAAYQEALDLIQNGVRDLANVRGVLSATAKTIEDQNYRNEEDMTNLAEVISQIKQVDIPSATVELKALETQIQASYSASVTLLRLSLTNFL